MNKAKKVIIAFVAFATLVFTSMNVSAVNNDDPTGDVYHHNWSENAWSWVSSSVNKPEIDITELTYEVSGNTLTVTMKTVDDIQDSPKYVYSIVYNATDGIYTFSYVNGEGFAIAMGETGFQMGQLTVNGNTMTGTIELINDSTFIGIIGIAAEYLEDYDQITDPEVIEYYADYAPTDLAPWYTPDNEDNQGDDTSNGGTQDTTGSTDDNKGSPGFELIALFTGFAILIFIFRKRKK